MPSAFPSDTLPLMPEAFHNVIVFDHPLIQHKLTWLRDRDTSSRAFRALMYQIAGLMVYEVTREVPCVFVGAADLAGPMVGMQFWY